MKATDLNGPSQHDGADGVGAAGCPEGKAYSILSSCRAHRAMVIYRAVGLVCLRDKRAGAVDVCYYGRSV